MLGAVTCEGICALIRYRVESQGGRRTPYVYIDCSGFLPSTVSPRIYFIASVVVVLLVFQRLTIQLLMVALVATYALFWSCTLLV